MLVPLISINTLPIKDYQWPCLITGRSIGHHLRLYVPEFGGHTCLVRICGWGLDSCGPKTLNYHLVMTNIAMENPPNKWRFLAGKIIYTWAMFHGYVSHNQRVLSPGWWFGAFVPYIGNNHHNWRTHIFQRGWNHQPGSYCIICLTKNPWVILYHMSITSRWIGLRERLQNI